MDANKLFITTTKFDKKKIRMDMDEPQHKEVKNKIDFISTDRLEIIQN